MAFVKQELNMQLAVRGILADAVVFEHTVSTNTDARRLASAFAGDFLVAANSQSGGKGSHGRAFHSPAGGFYLTAVLRGIDWQLPVTAAAGVAAADALHEVCGRAVSLKWVNDVRYAGRKAGGILCERLGDGTVLVGLGLNLQQPEGGFPAELADIAGALDVSAEHCNALAASFYASLRQLAAEPSAVLPRYRALCETLGQHIRFTLDGQQLTGIARAVDEQTALTVQLDGGGEVTLQSGEASVRPV